MDHNSSSMTEFNMVVRNNVEYVRQVPNRDIEFKQMMFEDELRKEQNKTLEVNDDWSLYDDQYPRLGPIIFHEKENASFSTGKIE